MSFQEILLKYDMREVVMRIYRINLFIESFPRSNSFDEFKKINQIYVCVNTDENVMWINTWIVIMSCGDMNRHEKHMTEMISICQLIPLSLKLSVSYLPMISRISLKSSDVC